MSDKNFPMAISDEQQKNFLEKLNSALSMVDDIVSKNYITQLSQFDVVPFPLNDKEAENDLNSNLRLFKITEMAYEKNEFASHKFATAFNALSSIKCAVFLIIKSDGQSTSFYMGIRSNDEKHTTTSIKDTLKRAVQGQFPGIKIGDDYLNPDVHKLISSIEADGICSVSCVANSRNSDNRINDAFVQGLEKFALSMQGEKYTAVILANNTSREQITKLRKDYESIYTQLSTFASRQISNASNSSVTFSEAISHTDTQGTNEARSTTNTTGHSFSATEGKNESKSSKSFMGAIGALTVILAPLMPAYTSGTSSSSSESNSSSESTSNTYGANKSTSDGQTHTTGNQSGTSQTITFTQNDKNISGILEKIDTQLKRIREFESLGMWECAAYFMSDSVYTAELAASSYKALMSGENSGVETSAINSWSISSRDSHVKSQTPQVAKYVTNFTHPVFIYPSSKGDIPVTPSSFVSGNELALHMGLPRHSVRGLPVIEHASFAPEIVRYDNKIPEHTVAIGNAFNMGSEISGCINLDRDSLTMHTFITGSTGAGKSNTIYGIIEQLNNSGIKFMVIEPAKGEYKNIFGNRSDVLVLGTNPNYSKLLRINPFKFAHGVHVLEHIDRLLDVFNVCWPMYAAMPAVLKSAMSNAYENCGWDLATSQNRFTEEIFPTFSDLLSELSEVISISAYSLDTKGDYIGALSTRISSLTNGINGQIFCADEIDNATLFDRNVIIDLSRIGSMETKSLIMGMLLIRLHEHRSTNSENMNLALQHVTVLEEAHHLIKRTSTEQNIEGANIAGKSVEMLSNSIAEMRTWGEGFIIADQSPNALDVSAIRNTNTKIIMRLPDEADRKMVGKSASLTDEQIDEIAKLPGGVAAVYQNDWLAPVLCKVKKFETESKKYEYTPDTREQFNERLLKNELIKLLLKKRTSDEVEPNIEIIERDLKKLPAKANIKLVIARCVQEYKKGGELSLWEEDKFSELSQIITDLLCGRDRLEKIITLDTSAPEAQSLLFHEVERYIPDLSFTMKIAACQCLMKQYSKTDNERLKLYAEWRECITKGAEIK